MVWTDHGVIILNPHEDEKLRYSIASYLASAIFGFRVTGGWIL